MSKHIGRKQRWRQESETLYLSEFGRVAFRERAWFGLLDYRTMTLGDDQLPHWEAHHLRLGPFKRPRNAMLALEQEATVLRNRHGDHVLFGEQLWAEQ
ncbi:MAG: hypothetical protein JNM56_15280 [Planctomycetia bacterium]|nr:hypothetical protein [Planctomycetia bacterium]